MDARNEDSKEEFVNEHRTVPSRGLSRRTIGGAALAALAGTAMASGESAATALAPAGRMLITGLPAASPAPASAVTAGATASSASPTAFSGRTALSGADRLPMLTRTGVVATRILGYSVQGRPITAYQLGDPAAAFTAVVLGSMHGYWEQAGQQVTSAMRSTAIPRGLNLWVIDTVNPDGNALRQRTNAHGVDLNRNWPNKWAPIARGGVFDSHYSGPAALSEPETRAMHTFLIAVRPQRVVSMHQPLNGVDTTDGGAKDVPFRTALAGRLGLPAKPFTCHDVCRGSMTGWLTNYTSTVGITVEFPGAQSAAQSPSTGPSTQYLRGPAAAGVLAALMTGVAVPPPAPPAPPYPRIPPASAASFVELFYRGVLGHGSAGNPWAPALVAGTKSRTQVATAIAMSTERRNLLVSTAFTRCLGRSSTSPAFVAAFMNGTSSNWAALLGRLAGSGEAFNRASRNPGRWVDQSYRSILNRSAALGEQAYWADISARTGLIAAATAIASAPEAQRYWLDQLYLGVLGRHVDGAGLATYGRLAVGNGQLTIPIALAGSGEYLNRTR